MERENGRGLVDLDDFDIVNLQVGQPEDVQLRNDATYMVVPRRGKSYEKRVSSFCRILLSVIGFQIIADLGNLNFTSYLHLFPFEFAASTQRSSAEESERRF